MIIDVVDLSPNVNRDGNGNPLPMPATTRTVLIHATRSGTSQNPSEYIGTRNFMRRPGTTSSQLVIGREPSQTARVVPDEQQAWHAQEDNDNTWGIELCQGIEADGFTDAQMAQLVAAGKHYMTLGVPTVHATSSTQPGFIGHQETAQGRRNGKSDPGRLFDWDWFLAALQEEEMQYRDHRPFVFADWLIEQWLGTEARIERVYGDLVYNADGSTTARYYDPTRPEVPPIVITSPERPSWL